MSRLTRSVGLCALILCVATLGSGQTTLEMKEQAGVELETADKELNKVYGELRAKLRDPQKEKLKEVQLAWIKYRDLAADFEGAAYEGGSMVSIIKLNVLTTLTEQRTEQLKNCFVEGYEGNAESATEAAAE